LLRHLLVRWLVEGTMPSLARLQWLRSEVVGGRCGFASVSRHANGTEKIKVVLEDPQVPRSRTPCMLLLSMLDHIQHFMQRDGSIVTDKGHRESGGRSVVMIWIRQPARGTVRIGAHGWPGGHDGGPDDQHPGGHDHDGSGKGGPRRGRSSDNSDPWQFGSDPWRQSSGQRPAKQPRGRQMWQVKVRPLVQPDESTTPDPPMLVRTTTVRADVATKQLQDQVLVMRSLVRAWSSVTSSCGSSSISLSCDVMAKAAASCLFRDAVRVLLGLYHLRRAFWQDCQAAGEAATLRMARTQHDMSPTVFSMCVDIFAKGMMRQYRLDATL